MMEGINQNSGFAAAEGTEGAVAAAAAAASPAAIILGFLARPLSLLRHIAQGLASCLKPAAAASASACACPPQQEKAAAAAVVTTEEVVAVVEVRSRGMILPQQPRGLREGKGRNGGPHH